MSQKLEVGERRSLASNYTLTTDYGDVVIAECLGKIAEINEFSACDEML